MTVRYGALCRMCMLKDAASPPCEGCYDEEQGKFTFYQPPSLQSLLAEPLTKPVPETAQEKRIDIIGQNGNEGLHYGLAPEQAKQKSDGSTASYYELPAGATELQDLIAFKNMNGQMAEIFRANYRYGQVEHSSKLRDIKKIIFYAQAELDRLLKYEYITSWEDQ